MLKRPFFSLSLEPKKNPYQTSMESSLEMKSWLRFGDLYLICLVARGLRILKNGFSNEKRNS